MVRVDPDSGLGVAVSTDCNGRFAKLDPYAGAQLALAESYRNVATSGARPLAVSDCLNFGSPEDPDVMWQFAEATRGLADGCQALGIPVTGGNVSLYNQTGETAILPTPVVAVLGVIDDVARRTPSGFLAEGQQIYLLGTTRDELAGSEWVHVVHGHLGGLPPVVDLRASRSSRTSWSTRRATGSSTPRTTCPTAGWPRRWWSLPAQRRRRPGVAARTSSTRSSRCSASRPAGWWWPCRARRRSGSPRCARRGFATPHRGHRSARTPSRRRGPVRARATPRLGRPRALG